MFIKKDSIFYFDISGSLKILDNISVILSTKNIIPIPLLVIHYVQALGTEKGFINLITEQNNCVSFLISRNFYAPVNQVKHYAALN